jgi:FlgD Ig-like domain
MGLLVLTAAAFVITERLKQTKEPIYRPRVSNADGKVLKSFSPTCGCLTDRAHFSVRLRHPVTLTVTIVDSQGHVVRTFAYRRHYSKGLAEWVWDGRTDAATIAPDGVYNPEISLPHRKFLLAANRIVVDTATPKVLSASAAKPILFAGPGRSVAIHYTLSKHAHAAVYLGGRARPIILGRTKKKSDKVKWAGTLEGRPLPPGTYVLSVGAQDVAGNQTPVAKRKNVTVELRYIQLTPDLLTVRGGRPLRVQVRTAAKRYTWRLGQRHGAHRGRVLRLRAPTTPGTYRLVVSEDGQSTTATVRVHG